MSPALRLASILSGFRVDIVGVVLSPPLTPKDKDTQAGLLLKLSCSVRVGAGPYPGHDEGRPFWHMVLELLEGGAISPPDS